MTYISCTDEFDLVNEVGVANTCRAMRPAVCASAFAIAAFPLLLRWRLTPELTLMSPEQAL
jgi:hypothetical protein